MNIDDPENRLPENLVVPPFSPLHENSRPGRLFLLFYRLMDKKNNDTIVTVGLVALGCPKAVVDSERMLAELAQAGFVITDDTDAADVVVINTCAFIAPARAEAMEAINHALQQKSRGNVTKVIVTGCLPEHLGRQLLSQAKGVDAIVGLGRRDNIAKIVKKTIRAKHPVAFLESSHRRVSNDRGRLLITPAHRAYLRISEGCDHRCSFCTIPTIRGRFRSKNPKNIIAEARELVSAGVAELNLIGQDTTCYGRDFNKKDALASLLRKLEEIAGLTWIRLLYAWPAAITDKLIETIAAGEKIVPYLDMPIQHISPGILKAMRRPDGREQITRLVEKLRSDTPGIVLRTTVIVGFPGETEAEFNELLEFIRWARFDALGCFTYYREAGTDAAMMDGQLPDEVKRQRREELMLAQQKIAFEKNAGRIGAELACLVDSVDTQGRLLGRFYGQAPDIDGLCIIKNGSAAAGSFVQVRVTDVQGYDLVVEQI